MVNGPAAAGPDSPWPCCNACRTGRWWSATTGPFLKSWPSCPSWPQWPFTRCYQAVSREVRKTGHWRCHRLRQMHRMNSTGCSHHDRTGRSAMEPNAALWLGKVTLDPLRSSRRNPLHPVGHASPYRPAQGTVGTDSSFYCVCSCSPPRPPPRPRAVAGRSRAAASCSDTAGRRPR